MVNYLRIFQCREEILFRSPSGASDFLPDEGYILFGDPKLDTKGSLTSSEQETSEVEGRKRSSHSILSGLSETGQLY